MLKNFEGFENVEEIEKEFYYYLGLASTKFASMESCLIDVMRWITSQDFIIMNTILECNSLSQNLELLKKLNRYSRWQPERIQKIYTSIANVRTKRNLFIHGIWGKPYKKNDKYFVNCHESKLIYSEKDNKRSWSDGRLNKFEIKDIEKLVWQVTDVIIELEKISFEFEDGMFQ